MDSEVSQRKFQAEVESLGGEAAAYASAKGWRVISADYPLLAVALRHSRSGREIEFRFSCNDWDGMPPSLTLHDPADGRELGWSEWPKRGWSVLNSHPSTGRPFLCLPGIREYHSHSSHVRDRWDGYRLRGSYRLRDIVDRVQQRFEDSGG